MSELAGRYFPCGCWQSFMAASFGEVEFCPEHQEEWDRYKSSLYLGEDFPPWSEA